MNNNLPFYTAAVFIFVLLKFGFRELETNSLLWLLKPVSILVEMFTGLKATYIEQEGFYFGNIDIVINKSCAGYNFGLLCFLMLSGLALNFYHSVFKKTAVLFGSLLIAYCLTVFVNACRILSSITISNINSILPFNESTIHQATGITINLSFLIIIYLVTNYFLTNRL